jgi:2-polyprenyl-3-methyl-5-hydroxy-6-metoxy-1,4-benzoquinol methylase
MTDVDYTRRYFSDGARAWLAGAYADADAAVYPVGARRVRLALSAVLERLGAAGGRLIDLGCGGGDLCLEAALLGFDTVGVDIAEGMIAEAEARRATLPEAARGRLRVRVGDALRAAPGEEKADAVTALGLLEYLPDDGAFFGHAAALLRPGGVLVVSCRNRLFNLASLNRYTREECQRGEVARLLDELAEGAPGAGALDAMADFVGRLRAALPALEAALAADRAAGPAAAATPAGFAQPRRQHTPRELATAAAAAGFRAPAFISVHPHPWPPAWERTAPRLYNRLASVFEAFERTPGSLAWSSAFLGVFTR